MMNIQERVAIYPGSFDPTTNGHKWVMSKVSQSYGKGYVAIGINTEKTPRFPVSEREQMLNEIIENDFPNLVVTSFLGLYLVDFAEMVGAKDIIRGTRNSTDFGYESDIKHVNTTINPKLETIVFVPPKELLQVSSSMVMGLVGCEGWQDEVLKMVPEPVFKRIEVRQETLDKKYLWAKWQALWGRLDAKGKPEVVFEDLIQRYRESNRKYHNLEHLKTCLNELELIRDKKIAENYNELELAIWFHDAVYESNKEELFKNADDEGKSAQLAVEVLTKQMGLNRDLADNVALLVLATKHNIEPQNNDGKLIVDIDLAILGRSDRLFNIYDRKITDEFSWAPPDIFVIKRCEVLKSFLPPQRPTIYQTAFFKERYEEQARKNLQRSIKEKQESIS